MITTREEALARVQASLGVTFADPRGLDTALTHTSYAHENQVEDSQRLEFLGDAVLQIIVTAWLYARFPELGEGALNDLRQQFVCEATLAELARGLDLGRAIRLGVGDRRSNRHEQASVLADAYEAVLGAVFLDAGLDAATAMVRPGLETFAFVHDSQRVVPNPKSTLQELTQARWRQTPSYRVVATDGVDHAPRYAVEVLLGERVLASGEGANKKEATRDAALRALIALEAEP